MPLGTRTSRKDYHIEPQERKDWDNNILDLDEHKAKEIRTALPLRVDGETAANQSDHRLLTIDMATEDRPGVIRLPPSDNIYYAMRNGEWTALLTDIALNRNTLNRDEPPGGSDGGTCQALCTAAGVNGNGSMNLSNVQYDATVTLESTTNHGYTWNGWTLVDGEVTLADPSADNTTFNARLKTTIIRANWSRNQWTLTVNSAPAGGSASGGGVKFFNEPVNLTSTAPPDYSVQKPSTYRTTGPSGYNGTKTIWRTDHYDWYTYSSVAWSTNNGGSFHNPNVQNPIFTMPNNDVTVVAEWTATYSHSTSDAEVIHEQGIHVVV